MSARKDPPLFCGPLLGPLAGIGGFLPPNVRRHIRLSPDICCQGGIDHMDKSCVLSNVTRDYLSTFRCILDEMIRDMTEAELTDSISHNFIVQMIPHHRAAIEMSRSILRYTTCVPVQEIAERIIEEQTKSIENMERVLCRCSEQVDCEHDLSLYQCRVNQILQTMFAGMGGARSDNDVTANFLREMIPHHCGAVELSENALRWDICPALKPILEAIITSQKRGIRQMRQLLRCM